MVYNYVPYMILPLYTSMTKIDQSVVEAAQDLGATTTKYPCGRVLIPMTVPGISTGITMVFVPGGVHLRHQPDAGRRLQPAHRRPDRDAVPGQQLQPTTSAAAMSLVLMVIVLLCMSFTTSFDEDEMEGVS